MHVICQRVNKFEIKMVVIDGHTHFAGPGKGLPPNTVEDLLAIMDGTGIDSMVTCAPYSSIGRDRTFDNENRFLVESMSSSPRRSSASLWGIPAY